MALIIHEKKIQVGSGCRCDQTKGYWFLPCLLQWLLNNLYIFLCFFCIFDCQYNLFRKIRSRTCIPLRTGQENMATFFEPFNCDLHPNFPNHLLTAIHKRAQSTLKPHQQCGTNPTSKCSYPQPQHTRGTLHRGPAPLHTEKYKVSRPFIGVSCHLMGSFFHLPPSYHITVTPPFIMPYKLSHHPSSCYITVTPPFIIRYKVSYHPSSCYITLTPPFIMLCNCHITLHYAMHTTIHHAI